jgi:archaellum biogenesis ATPase FlaH
MILTRVWRDQPGKFFCISTKSGTKKWRDHFFERSELNEVEQFIKDNRDKDIYFCPHGFTHERRIKEYAVPPQVLWSDLDERDPRLIKLKPTIAIESSPGRFVGLWIVDKPIKEDLNRRLSYSVGADKSGWDFTQVLRVPGTVNYKYTSLPKSRLLWSDGPRYTVSELEKSLPSFAPSTPVSSSDAAKIFKKYEDKIPHWCRKELMGGKPTPGKRSEMLWKMEQTLIELGITTEEAFLLIRSSGWNKFAGRRNGDEQLRKELGKVVNGHMNGTKHAVPDSEISLAFRSMDQVEEENIDWIYYPYFALGELTILEGDPGLGKSYLMQMIAGYICDGKKLPSVRNGHFAKKAQGKVVYFDMENSAGTVTKKRLVSNGITQLENFIQCEEPFSIDDEAFMDEVYDYLEKHRPVMVVFDTVNTYLGKADAFKGHEAQQAFIRFREISKRFNCSVVVLRHLTKSTKERALYRGQGNIAFAGVARVVLTVGSMPDDPDTRVMAVTKINVARTPKALTFSIESLPDTLRETDRSRFVWGEFCDLTSDDIVAPVDNKDSKKELEAATEFLEQQLERGEVDLHRLEKMAEARSMSMKLMNRAAKELGVKKQVKGFGKQKTSVWSLEEQPSQQ